MGILHELPPFLCIDGMEVIVQDLAVASDEGVLPDMDPLPGVDRCPGDPDVVADLDDGPRSPGHDDGPAVKADQVAQKAALDRDVPADLQPGPAFIEDDGHPLQEELFSIFDFGHPHDELEPVAVHIFPL